VGHQWGGMGGFCQATASHVPVPAYSEVTVLKKRVLMNINRGEGSYGKKASRTSVPVTTSS
jgi:hypothetical protein